MALYEEKFVLSDCISDVFGIIDMQAKSKNQQLQILSEEVVHDILYGDMMKLKQILINLLNNAVKYTPVGGRIQLVIHEIKSVNKKLVNFEFLIKDNGIGMSQEFLDRIGQPFEQEKNQFYGQENGTGLGLSIVKNIVSIMGGTMDIKSQLKKGTMVRIQLSFKEGEQDDYKDKDKLKDMRVFLVDDDPMVLQDVGAILEEFMIHVDTALTGLEAFHQIEDGFKQQNDYDVVIIDWKLPDIDGVHLTQMIREKIGREIPIVFISAYDFSEIEEEAYAVGVNDFIEKPLFKSRLYHALVSLKNETHEESYNDSSLSNQKILLVEDNELNLEIAKELLEMKGVTVVCARNGKEAVEIFKGSQLDEYQVILMDIQMPIMNGYEATQAIRLLERDDALRIPIIAMSANAFSDDVQRCLDVGMNGHIAKPISLTSITQTVIEVLEKGGKKDER